MANASGKGGGMGRGNVQGHEGGIATDPGLLDEHDLADEIGGDNKLQGTDQSRARNQRTTQPGSLDRDNQPPPAVGEPLGGDERVARDGDGRREG